MNDPKDKRYTITILCTNELLVDLWDHTLDTYQPECSLERFRAMPRPFQVFYLIFWWDCECQNGGMGQFILSHSGDLYIETIDALVTIGAIRSASWLSLIQEAIDTTLSGDMDTRHKQLGDLEIDSLNEISEQATTRVTALYGAWESEENELKFLACVERHSLTGAISDR